MKQISSKLNIYVRDANIINNDIERITFRFIFWSFGILAFLYVFLLGNMVSNIVQRRNLEVDARALGNEVRKSITFFIDSKKPKIKLMAK